MEDVPCIRLQDELLTASKGISGANFSLKLVTIL